MKVFIYTFAKLKGTENFKGWAKELSFALQNASLISYANAKVLKPVSYTEKEPAAVSKEKIDKREADIEKWILNEYRNQHAHSCRKVLTNFWSVKETTNTATRVAIVSCGRSGVVKMMTHGEVTFQEVLYLYPYSC